MRSVVRGLTILIAVLGVFVLPSSAATTPTFPTLAGRVVDDAGIIPPEVAASIEAKLAALEQKTTDQFVVTTIKSLQGYDIQDYGYQLGRAWGIGQKDKNNGVILLVAPNERKVGFEVGYGLEGTLTDALTQVIIQNAILPRFRDNDMAGGIERGVDDTIQVLAGDPTELQKLAERRPADGGFWNSFIPVLIFIVIIIVINNLRRHGRRGPWGTILGSAAGWSAGRSWGSGSWGGGSSGGGFSGGGGSFGGGGSSGSW
jgi:uncharacterized protein